MKWEELQQVCGLLFGLTIGCMIGTAVIRAITNKGAAMTKKMIAVEALGLVLLCSALWATAKESAPTGLAVGLWALTIVGWVAVGVALFQERSLFARTRIWNVVFDVQEQNDTNLPSLFVTFDYKVLPAFRKESDGWDTYKCIGIKHNKGWYNPRTGEPYDYETQCDLDTELTKTRLLSLNYPSSINFFRSQNPPRL